MATRAELRAKQNAVGQGRPKATPNEELNGELLTEVPPKPVDLVDSKAGEYWDKYCQILIVRNVLKPAHFLDLLNFCNCHSLIASLDSQIAPLQDKMAVQDDLKEKASTLAIIEKLIKLRKAYIDTTLTIGSRYGFDALSERRFTTGTPSVKTVNNGFLEL